MGLSSHTQKNDRPIAPRIPETDPCFGAGLFLSSGDSTAEARPVGTIFSHQLATAVVDACTGRAVTGTRNSSRIAAMHLGGVA